MRVVEFICSNCPGLKLGEDEATSDAALDFTSFLLRYNRDLDYSDFSEDQGIVKKIRRAETFRTWADIEDLANNFVDVSQSLSSH